MHTHTHHAPQEVQAHTLHLIASGIVVAHVFINEHTLRWVCNAGMDSHSAVMHGQQCVVQVVGEVVVGGKGMTHGGDAMGMAAAGELGNVIELKVCRWTPCALGDLDQGRG